MMAHVHAGSGRREGICHRARLVAAAVIHQHEFEAIGGLQTCEVVKQLVEVALDDPGFIKSGDDEAHQWPVRLHKNPRNPSLPCCPGQSSPVYSSAPNHTSDHRAAARGRGSQAWAHAWVTNCSPVWD